MDFPTNRELIKWITEQENLCREIIAYLLPQQKVEINFEEYLPNDIWGMALYQESDIKQANLAYTRFDASNNLDQWGVKYLTTYTKQPSKILISCETLKTKWADGLTEPAGFLPTVAHEAAHVSWQVNLNPLYRPWIEKGHDGVWKKVSQEFLTKVQAKFGQQVEKKFKQLSLILKNQS